MASKAIRLNIGSIFPKGPGKIYFYRYQVDGHRKTINISSDGWTLLDKKGFEIEDENIFTDGKILATGDYIIKPESDKNIAYSITSGLA